MPVHIRNYSFFQADFLQIFFLQVLLKVLYITREQTECNVKKPVVSKVLYKVLYKQILFSYAFKVFIASDVNSDFDSFVYKIARIDGMLFYHEFIDAIDIFCDKEISQPVFDFFV